MKPGLWDAVPVYIKIGLLSFGGPAGQIGLMNDEIVQRRGWVQGEAFQRGLNVAMLLPGPEAQQLATWLGWRLHGVIGGLAAGLAFVLPGAALMILLAWIAAAYGQVPLIGAVFYGVQPAVLVIVAIALFRIAQRALKLPVHWALALAAFLGIWALGLPFPLIVALAAIAGVFLPGDDAGKVAQDALTVSRSYLIGVFAVSILLIAGVWLITRASLGPDPYDGVAELFTSAAFVSFGGAYALLPYVADRAVETYQWLSAEQMLNGLAIAEATPGPLILVNVYAGFFAGWPGGGVLTACLACFYTFAPSFMLILAAAPYVEAMQRLAWVRRALAGVSAAVVGVIANLAVYLGEAALFPDGFAAPEWPKLALLAVFAGLAVWRQLPMLVLVALGAISGVLLLGLGVI